MRCPDCNKFVGFDEPDIGEIGCDLDEDSGVLSITGRLVLPCAECGAELKECSVDHEEDLSSLFDGLPGDQDMSKVKYELDGDPDVIATERQQTTTSNRRKQKDGAIAVVQVPIKSARYMKTYRGVEVTGRIKRMIDGLEDCLGDYTVAIEEQASAFDECC